MPRQSRIDAPGAIHHIIVRGIERRRIFDDDLDRCRFLERLGLIFDQTQTQCYARALIQNHFHLLIRTGNVTVASVMRRLLTGHAVNYNGRHNRHGHLFQKQYKSILCQDEPYFLELVRYIHLNPLRARLVDNINQILSNSYCLGWTQLSKFGASPRSHIVEFEQAGKIKAEYGKELLLSLSKDLKTRYGKGFSRSNLQYMRLLYIYYPKRQTLSGKLSWSHYVELLSISDDAGRSFYENQCIAENWSVRELKRQRNASLFERIALSRDKNEVAALASQGQVIETSKDIVVNGN